MQTALQPASEIPLQLGPHIVMLRAPLRVAVALEALPGGIASHWDEIARQKTAALHTVIRLAATDRQQAEALLAYGARNPYAQFHGSAQAICLTLLSSLLMPAKEEAVATSSAKPVPLTQFFSELFCRATSWLHWPPSEVWNASVAEIVAALEAKADHELRRAGVSPSNKQPDFDQRQANIEAGLDPDFDRAGLHALKAKLKGGV